MTRHLDDLLTRASRHRALERHLSTPAPRPQAPLPRRQRAHYRARLADALQRTLQRRLRRTPKP